MGRVNCRIMVSATCGRGVWGLDIELRVGVLCRVWLLLKRSCRA